LITVSRAPEKGLFCFVLFVVNGLIFVYSVTDERWNKESDLADFSLNAIG